MSSEQATAGRYEMESASTGGEPSEDRKETNIETLETGYGYKEIKVE